MNKIYQLAFDDIEDRDIDEWLNKWSRNKKAEMVRHALRYYIAYHGQASYPIVAPPVQKQDEPQIKKQRPNLSNLRGAK